MGVLCEVEWNCLCEVQMRVFCMRLSEISNAGVLLRGSSKIYSCEVQMGGPFVRLRETCSCEV